MKKTLEVKTLEKIYPGTKALDQVSFSIKKGEIVGLVGENGAGKSTCLKIIIGLLKPNKGKVKINGENLFPFPEKKRKNIGYLPEGNPLPDNLRVIEYLDFQGKIKGLKKEKRKLQIKELLKITQLEDKKYHFINVLSSGYKQRVGLCAAFLGYPHIILLDEPTRGLDPHQIIILREIIKKISKNSAVLISTHGLDELEKISSRFLFLKKGKLIHDGPLPDKNSSLLEFFLNSRENKIV
jgi:gliding motility-associated transport system ATP-binding protein